MRHEKLGKELEMLLMLSDTEDYSVEEICRRVGISRRNFYYYISFMRDNGFAFFKHNRCYHIDQRSPFLKKLFDLVQFTEDEAVTLRKLLDMVGDSNPLVNSLRQKLERFYDFKIINDPALRKKTAQMVSTLYEGIKLKQVVKILGYSSPHSKSTSDRFVEPYMFLNNNNDIRCYEISTGQCKTFRLSRMEDVELLNLRWSNESDHKQLFTDIFLFSGEEHHPVELRLGQLAYNVFMEEYPAGRKFVRQEDDSHWILSLEVCDYRGIGRFALGLFEDVDILGDDGLKDYIRERVGQMGRKLSQA